MKSAFEVQQAAVMLQEAEKRGLNEEQKTELEEEAASRVCRFCDRDVCVCARACSLVRVRARVRA